MWQTIFGEKKKYNIDKSLLDKLDGRHLPRHTAIIMDGNGRWAKARGLIRTAGHAVGVNTLKNILKTAIDLQLEVLTVYAFSTENWKRPPEEVDFLMNLFYDYLKEQLAEMKRDNVQLRFLGRMDELSPRLKKIADEAVAALNENTGVTLAVAMNYGGQDELLRAMRRLAAQTANGTLKPESISLADIETSLDTNGLPPVDLVIRTSGDLRLSNFLLWQTAYAEFYSSPKNWPDFEPADFIAALYDYSCRERRFGNVKAKN